MRFVSSYCLREGMVLGKSIYSSNGVALLKSNSELKKNCLDRIIDMGLIGVYIKDELSKDIEVRDVISSELRQEATNGVKCMFNAVSKNVSSRDKYSTDLIEAEELVNKVIDSLLESENLMVNMVDIKLFDERTYAHSVNVAVLSIIMGISMGMNERDLYELGLGALLHDIGKAFISPDIINKEGKLTFEEYETIKSHSLVGYQQVQYNKSIPKRSKLAILEHHERIDGSGYPDNKKGNEISEFAKIIAICDVYDALTSERSYKPSGLPSDAVEYIMSESTRLFDIKYVRIFCMNVAIYPSGSIVKVNNSDEQYIVIDNKPGFPTRPV